jgi:hypothetical protein
MSHKVTIYRYEDDGAKIKVHITDKFDCEKEAERFAYADPFVLAEHQFDMYKEDNMLCGSGYYAEIR